MGACLWVLRWMGGVESNEEKKEVQGRLPSHLSIYIALCALRRQLGIYSVSADALTESVHYGGGSRSRRK